MNIKTSRHSSNLLMQNEICFIIKLKDAVRLLPLTFTVYITKVLLTEMHDRDSARTSYVDQSCSTDWRLKWLFQQAVEYYTAFPLPWHFIWNGSCQCWVAQLDIPSVCWIICGLFMLHQAITINNVTFYALKDQADWYSNMQRVFIWCRHQMALRNLARRCFLSLIFVGFWQRGRTLKRRPTVVKKYVHPWSSASFHHRSREWTISCQRAELEIFDEMLWQSPPPRTLNAKVAHLIFHPRHNLTKEAAEVNRWSHKRLWLANMTRAKGCGSRLD